MVVSREGSANQLLKNDGGGFFTKVTGGTDNPIGATSTTNTKATAWCDFNNDGFLDLAVANDGAANEIHINDQVEWSARMPTRPTPCLAMIACAPTAAQPRSAPALHSAHLPCSPPRLTSPRSS